MFDDTDTGRLIAAMRTHGIALLEIEGQDTLLRLVLPAQPSAAIAPPPAPQHATARSPDIGAFLPRGGGDGLPGLTQGDIVQPREVLGYVTRGPVRAVVLAPAAGRIAGDPPGAGTTLGFGDPILHLEPS